MVSDEFGAVTVEVASEEGYSKCCCPSSEFLRKSYTVGHEKSFDPQVWLKGRTLSLLVYFWQEWFLGYPPENLSLLLILPFEDFKPVTGILQLLLHPLLSKSHVLLQVLSCSDLWVPHSWRCLRPWMGPWAAELGSTWLMEGMWAVRLSQPERCGHAAAPAGAG